MPYTPQPLEAHYATSEKVRSDEYFREARVMYDVAIHDPMAERYFYVLITCISMVIFLLVIYAANSLYPLKTPVPFIYKSRDIVEDFPRIKPLRAFEGEDAKDAVMRFLVSNYVLQREEYNIATIDRNIASIKSQTAKEAYEEFERFLDTRNSESPIKVYQRISTRSIEVLSVRSLVDAKTEVEVIFEATVNTTVNTKTETKKSRWLVNISFSYSGLALDDKGKPKSISFIVTKYRSKRLQDNR
ncbi:MAG: hypothetical protein EBR02_06645 [Alphaproteobacteria bacterium]|nr:hypothetical protein [Alphaproteobacteria bacterium]